MKRETYIGIDIGSSAIKFILIDETGTILKKHSLGYAVESPECGWKEIAPEKWYSTALEGLKTLLRNVDRYLVTRIGITGQMHTTVFLDAAGNSIRPAIMWNDTRTQTLVPILQEKLAHSPETQYLAQCISTGSPAANLCWLLQHEPENFSKLFRFLIGPDYLVYRFTGTYGTDFCEASTSSLFDWKQKTWSNKASELLGLPRKIFPSIHGSSHIAGTLLPEVATQIGLSPYVEVITGTGDNPSSALAAECFSTKAPLLSLGTSGVIMVAQKKIDFQSKGKKVLFSCDESSFSCLAQGTIQSCGSALEWWMKEILHSEISSFTATQVPDADMQNSTLLFYPHLTGEKTLYQDPSLRGAFLGLSPETSRLDMFYAIMEGISFGIRQLIEEFGISGTFNHLPVIGGGANNQLWLQILSDVLNVTIAPSQNISAVYGIALLASGLKGSPRSFPKNSLFSSEELVMPRAKMNRIYHTKYQKYLKIHDAAKKIYSLS